MPSKSSLFHVVGRLVAVDRNLGGGWLPRGCPHRTEHLELTAPLGGLTADRPPRTIRRSPPIMSLPVLSPSVGALSLKVSVFLQRKSPPLSDHATWFSETTERAMTHAASLTGQQGRGKGGTKKFQAGSLLRPNPSRTSRTSLSPVTRRRRLLQWCCVLQTRSPPDSSSLAPLPFLFLGRASQPAPSCWGPHGGRRWTSFLYQISQLHQTQWYGIHLISPSDERKTDGKRASRSIVLFLVFRRRTLRENGQTRLLL